YDVGRYLFVPFAGADARHVLDFNKAGNPLCNYSPHYNCPIPLPENRLPVPIRAGEMKYPTPERFQVKGHLTSVTVTTRGAFASPTDAWGRTSRSAAW
ncbi:MAG: DUF1684 domain-containing protein, partial [Acidobacteria bacterium]